MSAQRSRVTGTAQIASSGGSSADALLKTNNLSDLADAAAARTNLALASGATTDASTLVLKANNLSDLASATTARTNLGLHGGALLDVGTTAGTLAAGDDGRFTPGPLALTLAAATTDGLTLKVTGDTQPRLTANADGKIEWSDGTAAIDANLYRSAAGTVATDGALLVQSGVVGVRNVSTDPTNLAAMANFNNASMPWPVGVATAYGIVTAVTTQDVTATSVIAARLSATAGNGATVATARGLQVQGITTSGGGTVADARGIYVAAQSAGTTSYGVAVDAAATATLWLSADTNSTAAAGGIAFGSSRDTNLYRSAADTLKTDDSLIVAGASLQLTGATTYLAWLNATAASTTRLYSNVAGDANYRFRVNADGTLQWGDGTASVDTQLYRAGANVLKTGGDLQAATFTAGTTPATTGTVRLPNNVAVAWRNAANSADITLKVGSDNLLQIGNTTLTGSLAIETGALYLDGGTMTVGATPATAGAVRMTNATAMMWRNAANSGNTGSVTYDASDRLIINANAGVYLQYQGGTHLYSDSGGLNVGGVNLNLSGGGHLSLSSANIITTTSPGTKIATAADQKLGFWNATPVVQPAGWGTPTGTLTRTTFVSDSATLVQVATRLAALIVDLKATGLLGA